MRKALPELPCRVAATESYAGGGSAPTHALPSFAVAVVPPQTSVQALARELRLGDPAVFPRIEADELLFDLRTIRPGEERDLVAALVARLGGE